MSLSMSDIAKILPPSEKNSGMPPRRLLVVCFLAYALLGALLFLRPHQETFIGLDSSAIRMMTHAPIHGRDLFGVDRTLSLIPGELRPYFLYIPDPTQRMTRDRSFQLDDLQTGTYRPWFYPFLTYAALGLDWMVPGRAVDYFLPSLTLLFFVVAGIFMASKTGLPGLFVALALVAGLPLIPWFARGYYPEWPALLLVALVTLNWLRDPDRTPSGGTTSQPLGHAEPGAPEDRETHADTVLSPQRREKTLTPTDPPSTLPSLCFSALLLGLAGCFHPVILPWSGALFLLLIMASPAIRNLRVLAAGGCFALGLTPLIIVTQWMTRPYGDIFNPRWMLGTAQGSTLFFLLLLIAAAGLTVAGLFLTPWGRSLFRRLLLSPGWTAHALRLCTAMLPTGLLLLSEHTKTANLEGLADLWSILATPYGIIAAATILVSFLPAVRPRVRLLLVVTVALAGIYLYLKGIEPFGLWSQRRLLPVLLPFVVAALAIWRDVLRAYGHKWRSAILVPGAMAVLAGTMAMQHPAFYLLRAEFGADAALQELVAATQDGLTFFDYHQYGSPLAALGHPGALPLSNRLSDADRQDVLQWTGELARRETVRWVTAFANPGLEQGVVLHETRAIRTELPRLHARRAFPARIVQHPLHMRVLDVHPIPGRESPPRLDKILDRGPLALRGPWGRADIPLISPEGERLPARWTREGSAVIGPVPAPGESVKVELIAGVYRSGETDHQTLIITPPWEGPALELRIEKLHTTVSGYLKRPAQALVPLEATGPYAITSRRPYDPSLYGIRGFDPDLGVLLHRVRMEVDRHEQHGHGH